MNPRRLWLAGGLAVLAFVAREGRAEPLCRSSEAPPPQACVEPAPAPVGSAGMLIYRNSETGEFEAPPDDVAAEPPAKATPAPMVERMGVTPGGGVLLDNIPMMGVTATVDAAGQLTTRCDDDRAHVEGRP